MTAEATLRVEDLRTHFSTGAGVVRAVDGVSFVLRPGEIVGLVGESGSGKSALGLSIMGLIDEPGRIVGGRILFRGVELRGLMGKELRRLRGRDIAMVFQDPMTTLNPVLTIGTQIVEAIDAHERLARGARLRKAVDALHAVGIPSPAERLRSYPHELSGGMRQRVAIAIALLHRPALLIADEPTTALDVTVQAQILMLVKRLCREAGTALLWITHDLAVVSGLADRAAVMYAGKLAEEGAVREVLDHPRHPYTRGLIASVPSEQHLGGRLHQIPGSPPSPLELPEGCAFRNRCERSDARCARLPEAVAVSADQRFWCFHPLPASTDA